MKQLLLAGIIASTLAACSTDELSFDSVEASRKIANENAEFNAKTFRATHPEFATWSILSASDSTQSNKCGQGDGWETLTLLKLETNGKIPLKCSTVSASIGCMLDSDFKTKSYASQDGKCDTTLPYPLPKIEK
jgi:hypothetical protein